MFLTNCFRITLINFSMELQAAVSWQVVSSNQLKLLCLLSLNVIWHNEPEIRSLWSCMFLLQNGKL